MSAKGLDYDMRNKFHFVRSLFSTIFDKVYSGVVDPKHSEQSWYQSILWPVLVACSLYLRRMKAGEATFAPGEEELFSMTVAGPANSRAPYYADGVVRLANKSNTEICLLKTSKAMTKAKRAKFGFDHHKGMFALLPMLKRVANQYAMAEYTHLSSLDLYFLHAHGEAVRVWSMSTPQENVFMMNKCLKIHMPKTSIGRRMSSCSLSSLAGSFCIEALDELEKMHDNKKRSTRYNRNTIPVEQRLSTRVNPKRMKITEKILSKDLPADGPASSLL